MVTQRPEVSSGALYLTDWLIVDWLIEIDPLTEPEVNCFTKPWGLPVSDSQSWGYRHVLLLPEFRGHTLGVLILVQQPLYPLSHLPGPLIIRFIIVWHSSPGSSQTHDLCFCLLNAGIIGMSTNTQLKITLLLCLCSSVGTCVLRPMWGGQKTTFGCQFSASPFRWILPWFSCFCGCGGKSSWREALVCFSSMFWAHENKERLCLLSRKGWMWIRTSKEKHESTDKVRFCQGTENAEQMLTLTLRLCHFL